MVVVNFYDNERSKMLLLSTFLSYNLSDGKKICSFSRIGS